MPILPYCVALTRPDTLSIKGVGQSEVHRLEQDSLTALYSDVERSAISPKTFQQTAVEFHNVVHSVFANAGVVPFRFPTWLTHAELAAHLREESRRYCSFLTEHAEHVQMELRIIRASSDLPKASTSTGTEHLRSRAAQVRQMHTAAEELKLLLSAEVIGWRERESPEGLRLYALVGRNRVASFRERLSGCEHGVGLRWSGPWPATGFLD